jgi:hypothetical protein
MAMQETEIDSQIDELTMIRNVLKRLETLDDAGRDRAMQYIANRLGYQLSKMEAGS